jgi:hypothetical protein
MLEWWRKHFELKIECGLQKFDIIDVIEKSHLEFRDYVPDCLRLCHKYEVPFVIISAGSIGEGIPLFFAKNNLDLPNIHYV